MLYARISRIGESSRISPHGTDTRLRTAVRESRSSPRYPKIPQVRELPSPIQSMGFMPSLAPVRSGWPREHEVLPDRTRFLVPVERKESHAMDQYTDMADGWHHPHRIERWLSQCTNLFVELY